MPTARSTTSWWPPNRRVGAGRSSTPSTLYGGARPQSGGFAAPHAEIGRQFAIAYQASWHVQDVRGQRRGPDAPDPGQTSG